MNEENRELDSFPTRRSSDLLKRKKSRTARSRCVKLSTRLPIAPAKISDRISSCGRVRRAAVVTYHSSHTTAPQRSTISGDRKSTRLNSSHLGISYAVFCLKK